ncbi:MAG: hypothetical protein CR984_00875 [Proteobacteria bacterium]|nr:MAG: hypothetical protein CR984_00875 [Pseudomonadota bacterium]
MHLSRRRFIIGAAGSALALLLVLACLWTTYLPAGRDRLKTFIAAKAAQATGADLVYDRLSIDLFPLPHAKVHDIRLHRADRFDIRAHELSVYPDILSALKGHFTIRRLDLDAPDIRAELENDPFGKSDAPPKSDRIPALDRVREVLSGFFGTLTAIGPGTLVRIESGTVHLLSGDTAGWHVAEIDARVENDGGRISLALKCASRHTGRLTLNCDADVDGKLVRGRFTITGANPAPLLESVGIFSGLTIDNTDSTIHATFSIKDVESAHGHFDLRFPSLTVRRKGRKLTLERVLIDGSVDITGQGLSLAVDHLQSSRPPLSLSASAGWTPSNISDPGAIEIHAAAEQLDIEVASQVSRAIAGDLESIKTAFAVAREGLLTNVACQMRFDNSDNGYRQTGMKAAAHLSQGKVTIPGIDTDLQRMDSDIVYQDRHVAFNHVSGHFQGASFEKLDADIDWASASTLSIVSPAVRVEAKTFSSWLLSFKALAGMRQYIDAVDGTMRLTRLDISGPLTRPAEWDVDIHGSPENLEISSPLLPFTPIFNGGLVVYEPGRERVEDVAITFLDAALVASYQTSGIFEPASIDCRLDGSLGIDAITWLTGVLSVPDHLRPKPPIRFSGLHIDWSDEGRTHFEGAMETAGNISLLIDMDRLDETWDIRHLKFSDGRSSAVASGRMSPGCIEVMFSGNVEKTTADRILANNRSLMGHIEGDFQALIDTYRPMSSTFTGRLSGQGLRIHRLFPEPVDLKRFSIEGRAQRLFIAPSTIELFGSHLDVEGNLTHGGGDVGLDLRVDADSLDVELIQAIRALGQQGQTGTVETGETSTPAAFTGSVRVRTDALAYDNWVWSPVDAVVRLTPDTIRVNIDEANLCGIATVGELEFSSRGLDLHITPRAQAAPLAETVHCLFNRPVRAEARYELTGDIRLEEEKRDPLAHMTGHMALLSTHGRIEYSGVLMKVLAFLNLTEVFAGGSSDLAGKGYGYTEARVTSDIKDGKLHLNEILLDGHSLKITGQGSIDLKSKEVDIVLLAAPLKTVDRLVKKIPVINYIAGGSLVSIPFRLKGPLDNVTVSPMSATDVGKGLLNIMERTLNVPFRLLGPRETPESDGSAE